MSRPKKNMQEKNQGSKAQVLNFDYVTLKQAFLVAQKQLVVPKPFVLHKIRHGGFSTEYQQKLRTFAETNDRGGWVTDSSVRRHKAEARFQIVMQKQPKLP